MSFCDLFTGYIYDVAFLFNDESFLYIGYDPSIDKKSKNTFLFRVRFDGVIIWKLRIEGYLKRMHSIPVDKDGNTYLFVNCNCNSKIPSHFFYKINSKGECVIRKKLTVWVENCLLSHNGDIIAYVRQTSLPNGDDIYGEETYKLCLYSNELELLNEYQLPFRGKNGSYADLYYNLQIDYNENLIYSIGTYLYSFDSNLHVRWKINEAGQVFLRNDSKILVKKVREIVCIDLDGSIIWRLELTDNPCQFRHTLIVDKRNFFACFSHSMFDEDKNILCISPDGEIVWKTLLNKKTYGHAAVLNGDGQLIVLYGTDITKRKLKEKNCLNQCIVLRTFINR